MEGQTEEASISHGTKRRADDNLEHEQRLTKRFNLLNLEHNGSLYIPVSVKHAAPERPSRAGPDNESMQVDDTKGRVYIHNLDAELSDIETEEERLVFLPDIDKKLGKIPQSLLMGRSQPTANTQMILYNVPSSLSVAPEQDNVRKAIIETRARAREKQAHDTKLNSSTESEKGNGIRHNEYINEYAGRADMEDDNDEDAMDIG